MKKHPWWLLCIFMVLVLFKFCWSQPLQLQEYIGIGNTGKAVIEKDSLGQSIPIPKGWSINLMVYSEKGDSCLLRIGVDSLASNKFDKDLDVPIPPSPPGLFYTFLYLDDKDYPDIYTLSRDYRYFPEDSQNDEIVWLGGFGGNNSKGKKIIKWSTYGLEFINISQERKLTISSLGGKIVGPVEMSEIDSLVVPEDCGFIIRYK